VYKEKAFEGTRYRPQKALSNAVELGATALMFLVHPTLKQAEIDKSCALLSQVMQRASKRATQ
jgi:dTDP-4-amino-4,6-dideoxygalactose transaminase